MQLGQAEAKTSANAIPTSSSVHATSCIRNPFESGVATILAALGPDRTRPLAHSNTCNQVSVSPSLHANGSMYRESTSQSSTFVSNVSTSANKPPALEVSARPCVDPLEVAPNASNSALSQSSKFQPVSFSISTSSFDVPSLQSIASNFPPSVFLLISFLAFAN